MLFPLARSPRAEHAEDDGWLPAPPLEEDQQGMVTPHKEPPPRRLKGSGDIGCGAHAGLSERPPRKSHLTGAASMPELMVGSAAAAAATAAAAGAAAGVASGSPRHAPRAPRARSPSPVGGGGFAIASSPGHRLLPPLLPLRPRTDLGGSQHPHTPVLQEERPGSHAGVRSALPVASRRAWPGAHPSGPSPLPNSPAGRAVRPPKRGSSAQPRPPVAPDLLRPASACGAVPWPPSPVPNAAPLPTGASTGTAREEEEQEDGRSPTHVPTTPKALQRTRRASLAQGNEDENAVDETSMAPTPTAAAVVKETDDDDDAYEDMHEAAGQEVALPPRAAQGLPPYYNGEGEGEGEGTVALHGVARPKEFELPAWSGRPHSPTIRAVISSGGNVVAAAASNDEAGRAVAEAARRHEAVSATAEAAPVQQAATKAAATRATTAEAATDAEAAATAPKAAEEEEHALEMQPAIDTLNASLGAGLLLDVDADSTLEVGEPAPGSNARGAEQRGGRNGRGGGHLKRGELIRPPSRSAVAVCCRNPDDPMLDQTMPFRGGVMPYPLLADAARQLVSGGGARGSWSGMAVTGASPAKDLLRSRPRTPSAAARAAACASPCGSSTCASTASVTANTPCRPASGHDDATSRQALSTPMSKTRGGGLSLEGDGSPFAIISCARGGGGGGPGTCPRGHPKPSAQRRRPQTSDGLRTSRSLGNLQSTARGSPAYTVRRAAAPKVMLGILG